MNQFTTEYTTFKNLTLFHRARISGHKTLLVFIHGLGDSSISFHQFFNQPEFNDFDIIMPDTLGHGKTSAAEVCSYKLMTECLENQVGAYAQNYEKIILIPHSIAGIPATMLCHGKLKDKISGIFAIETSVTQHGSFLTENLEASVNASEDYNTWFDEFADDIYQKGVNDSILKIYHTGLMAVDRQAFLQIGLETRKLATKAKEEIFTHQIGNQFAELSIPVAYCYSNNGKSTDGNPNIPFLEQHNIQRVIIKSGSHWSAQADPENFSKALVSFIELI